MDINQSPSTFSGTAPFSTPLVQQAQASGQSARDEVHAETANSKAASPTDAAPLRADAPNQRVADGDGDDDRPAVAAADEQNETRRRTGGEHGDTGGRRVDLLV